MATDLHDPGTTGEYEFGHYTSAVPAPGWRGVYPVARVNFTLLLHARACKCIPMGGGPTFQIFLVTYITPDPHRLQQL